MKQRIITALLLLPLAVLLLFMPALHWFSLILIPIFAIMAWEWSRLLETSSKWIQGAFIVISLMILGLFYYQLELLQFFDKPELAMQGKLAANWMEVYPFKALLVALLVWLLALVLVLLYPTGTKLWTKGAMLRMLFGWTMLPIAWLAVVLIRSAQYSVDHYYGGWLLLLMFLIIWGADVGAYFAGKNFGKHKLAPIVSPNKTWEGVIGGMVTSFIAAYALASYMGLPVAIEYFVPMVIALGVVSVVGDLFESMLKRQAGIKDSSNILPGHGGLLDRLDSTISVAPLFVLFLLWINGGL